MWKNIFIRVSGTLIYSFSVSRILAPNQLAAGGVSGIAVLCDNFWPIGVGTWYFLMNIPILIVGVVLFGKKEMSRTLLTAIGCSALQNLFEVFLPSVALQDLPALALLGGVLQGIGIGLIFVSGATSGGMDIVVKILKRKYPYLRTGTIFIMADLMVVIMSGIVFGSIQRAIYAGLAVFVIGHFMNLVLYGNMQSVLLMVITEKADAICERLLYEKEVGVTLVNARGAFSGRTKKVLYCAVWRVKMHEIVSKIQTEDPGSFCVIVPASEIYGYGFEEHTE